MSTAPARDTLGWRRVPSFFRVVIKTWRGLADNRKRLLNVDLDSRFKDFRVYMFACERLRTVARYNHNIV